MRKMLLLVLVCILCVSVVGCGSANCAYYECKNAINSDNLCFKHVAEKKELEIFLKAFESIEAAYEIGKEMNSDIDKAYHFEKNNEVTDSTSKQFIDELSISTEDFYVGMLLWLEGSIEYTEEELESFEQEFPLLLEGFSDEERNLVCTMTLIGTCYIDKGEEMRVLLEDASRQMELIRNNMEVFTYFDESDYLHLEKYYNSVSNLLGKYKKFVELSNEDKDIETFKEFLSDIEKNEETMEKFRKEALYFPTNLMFFDMDK